MCDLCEQIDGFGPAPNRLTPELLAAAQAIERALPGTAVPAEAWTITSYPYGSGRLALMSLLEIAV